LKVVITGDDLSVLSEATRSYPVRHPRPGWAEQDARDFDAALGPAMAQALSRAGLGPSDVRALGVSGQLDGCVGVDERGQPVTPCLIWMDRRAQDELPAEILADPAGLRRVTGLVADATHMAAKIRWLMRHAPAAVCFHQPVSYLVERLTGARVFDHGLASTTMLYSLRERAFEPALLRAFGIAADALPAIAGASARAGELDAAGARLCGLLAGTPVAVGTGDDFATPLGAGLARPGKVACVLGTAEVVGALHREAVLDERGLVETHGYVNECFFIENPGWLSGGAISWLGQILGVDSAAELDALASAVPPGAEGLLFLPALSGAMAPEWVPGARGCFYGLTAAHHRGHMARAVMEGCAYAMRDVIDRLGELGVATDSIVLMGGGARSPLWSQIRADVAGMAVERARHVDTCPVGAAMLAAVAAGVVPDLGRAAELVATERESVAPVAGRAAIYREMHARYRLLFESLRPLY
jgi:xylulokinase